MKKKVTAKKRAYKGKPFDVFINEYKTDEVTIDEPRIIRLLQIVDVGLIGEIGNGIPGEMCIESAVNYALGGDTARDDPPCVYEDLRYLKIKFNDMGVWTSPDTRAAALRRLGVAQLGTNSGKFKKDKFNIHVMRSFIQYTLPIAAKIALKELATLIPKADIRIIRAVCKKLVGTPSLKNAERVKACLMKNKYYHYHGNYYMDMLVDHVCNIIRCYEDIGKVAHTLEDIICVICDVDRNIDNTIDGEHFAAVFFEKVVKILIKLKAPGADFLYLTKRKLPELELIELCPNLSLENTNAT